jgi:hypothetical protein
MTPTVERNLANRLASTQPERALSIARAIEAPWFRCQALSHVARYWPDKKYGHILEEAVRAADSQDETYQRAAVSAWPIRAYLERDDAVPARALLKKYSRAASSIANRGSRSEALFLLFQAAKPFAPDLWQPIFRALVEAAEPSLSWRQGRALRYAANMLICDDRRLVQEAVRQLSELKHLAALQALLDSDAPQLVPRPFFWTKATS